MCACCITIILIVPPAPENVRAYRLGNISMFVSWDTIPLTVSRGFVQNYTVTYQSHDKQLHVQLDEVTVLGNQNNVLIANLIPMQQYVVSVAASTSAGRGDASIPTLIFSNDDLMLLEFFISIITCFFMLF